MTSRYPLSIAPPADPDKEQHLTNPAPPAPAVGRVPGCPCRPGWGITIDQSPLAGLGHETAESGYMRRHGAGYNAAHDAA